MAIKKLVGEHVIDIDELRAKEIHRKGTKSALGHKIDRADYDKSKKDYEPSHLSIGPYYHGNPALRSMEKVKWGYLNYFLQLNHGKKLQDYVEAINGLENQARRFYANEIKMDKKSFVQMLLLDASFILMSFNRTDGIAPELKSSIGGSGFTMDSISNKDEWVIDVFENADIVQSNQWNVTSDHGNNCDEINDMLFSKVLMVDMLLLENQIPFFVILKIYEILTEGRRPISFLVKNIADSINDAFGCYPQTIQQYDHQIEIFHLLHLCHMYFHPSQKEENCQNYFPRPAPFHNFLHSGTKNKQKLSDDNDSKTLMANELPKHWRRGTHYHEARIELKKRKLCSDNDLYSLLDIRFINGTLEIPFLSLEPEIFPLFKNLIAFEQTSPRIGNYITSYVVFWSQFITREDDVALLIDKGIIRHGLHRDNEVADH